MRLRFAKAIFWPATLAGSILLAAPAPQATSRETAEGGTAVADDYYAEDEVQEEGLGFDEGTDAEFSGFRRPRRCQPECCSPGAAVVEGEGDQVESAAPEMEQAMLEPEQFGGTGADTPSVNDVAGGYIDNPVVGTWFRLRADAAYDNFRPDRAEFFYGQCGRRGPPQIERAVDYQEFATYIEYAPWRRLSFFTEVPVRFLNPVVNNNTAGLADINTGCKLALVADPDRYLTLQFRTYIPTGDGSRGLGTKHASVEPGLLFWRQVTDGVYLQGEVRHWVPIGGTDFAGNVIRYGMGLGIDLYRSASCDGLRITPIVETVGWTVFNGQAFNPNGQIESAAGDTIVNLKLGSRVTLGSRSLYSGWGHALTGDTWYRDLFRIEYRRQF